MEEDLQNKREMSMGFSKMVSFNSHPIGISYNLPNNLPKPFPTESCAYREVLSLHKVLGKQISLILTPGESLGLGVGGSAGRCWADVTDRPSLERQINKVFFIYQRS